MAKGSSKPPVEQTAGKVGVYIAYDGDGNELWRKDDFTVGRDKAPGGVLFAMKAMKIIDPKSGEVIARWNPWGVL